MRKTIIVFLVIIICCSVVMANGKKLGHIKSPEHEKGFDENFIGWIINFIVLIVLIVLVVQVTKLVKPSSPKKEKPIEILKTRYARGEISKEEFEKIIKDLQ